MKKKYVFVQFALIFIFFILPPLFVSKGLPGAATGNFSPWVLIQLILALALEVEHQLFFEPNTHPLGIAGVFKSLSWGTISLGLLMLVFALMQVLCMAFPFLADGSMSLSLPESPLRWLYVLLSLAVGAFYEEELYRQFLPYALTLFAEGKKGWHIFTEIFCLLVFAFSHRYLGWGAVINACLCGLILRLCRIKSLSCYAGSAAHFSYNLIIYAFTLLVSV